MMLVVVRLLVAVLVLVGTGAAVVPTPVHSNDPQEWETTTVPAQYIVKLRDYALPAERRQLIDEALTGVHDAHRPQPEPLTWHVLKRDNPAWSMPSDFALLHMAGQVEAVSLALSRLSIHEGISSVTTNKQVMRRLQHLDHHLDKEEISQSHWKVQHGRHMTSWNVSDSAQRHTGRKPLASGPNGGVSRALNAPFLWRHGYSGNGIRVGVFDTGLRARHNHFRNVVERTDWTDEDVLDDGVGHGSFVAGVIASSRECLGFAPNAQLHIFRVFTNKQVSFTAWFLDAFNYAIHTKMQVVNLSIGGPDFRDLPFVSKVNELTASGTILVSAIGNDGPLYGTLNNPADQTNVVGVGGINYSDRVAPFSSRGMSLWEIPYGYGRVKPDVVSYGVGVLGSSPSGGCRALSGTSVASPVVAGAVTLLASVIPEQDRERLLNPASVKQALIETATPVQGFNIFEQGQGKVNLTGAASFLLTYRPKASVVPAAVDARSKTCDFMWPLCSQPLYPGSQPLMVNLTVLNAMSVTGFIQNVAWKPNKDAHGDILDVAISHCDVIWPWAGWLALHVSVSSRAGRYVGVAGGLVSFTVQSSSGETSDVTFSVQVSVVTTPPRHKRLLWDQFHSISYPSGYIPRDNLDVKSDPLDWNGDHPHTNFRKTYLHLRSKGYFIEVLTGPFTCFDARDYGALLLIDSEEEFFDEEIVKLQQDVNELGLSLLVVADWYSEPVMESIQFFDENTYNQWYPETGGANIPALNELLGDWGIALSDQVFTGEFKFEDDTVGYRSGTTLARFPVGSRVIHAMLSNETSSLVEHTRKTSRVPIIGLHEPKGKQSGRVIIYGDSSCMDESHNRDKICTNLLETLILYSVHKFMPSALIAISEEVLTSTFSTLDVRRSEQSTLFLYSKVLGESNIAKLALPACRSLTWSRPQAIQQNEFESHVNQAGFRLPQALPRNPAPVGNNIDVDEGTHEYYVQLVGLFLFIGFLWIWRGRRIWNGCCRALDSKSYLPV